MMFKKWWIHALLLGGLSACQTVSHQPFHNSQQNKMTATTHTVNSQYSFQETVQRLQNAITSKGMTIFALIDHQNAAQKNGLTMQPAQVIIFGMPKVGTPLMQKDPSFALQLPLRVLVTEINGKVQVVYNDTRALVAHSSIIKYDDVANSLANAEKLIVHTVTQ